VIRGVMLGYRSISRRGRPQSIIVFERMTNPSFTCGLLMFQSQPNPGLIIPMSTTVGVSLVTTNLNFKIDSFDQSLTVKF
jgi:hypothetical protein